MLLRPGPMSRSVVRTSVMSSEASIVACADAEFDFVERLNISECTGFSSKYPSVI